MLLRLPGLSGGLSGRGRRRRPRCRRGGAHRRQGVKGYYGANPPAGHGPHRYLFAVHAVDTELPADEIANPTQLGFNLNFHSLGRAIIWGWYENQ